MHSLHTSKYVSITELKAHPNKVLSNVEHEAIAVLSHNKPKAYLLSQAEYENYLKYKQEHMLYERMQRIQAGNKVTLTIEQLDELGK